MRAANFLRRRLWVLGLGLASVSGCNNVGDAICPYGTNPDDRGDGCPYGPPGGPRVHEEGCPDIPQMSGAMCTLSWRNDIWPMLNDPKLPAGSGCGIVGCHGSGVGQLTLPTDDPVKSFNTLKAYAPQTGYPYLNDTAPGHTWILCNLHGDKGGRSPMPPAPNFPMPAANFDKIKLWAQCGEKLDSASGSGGGGGGASTSTATGAGGAGGN